MGWSEDTERAQNWYCMLIEAREAARGTSKEKAAQQACWDYMEGRCGSCVAALVPGRECPCQNTDNDAYEGFDENGPFDADGGL